MAAASAVVVEDRELVVLYLDSQERPAPSDSVRAVAVAHGDEEKFEVLELVPVLLGCLDRLQVIGDGSFNYFEIASLRQAASHEVAIEIDQLPTQTATRIAAFYILLTQIMR